MRIVQACRKLGLEFVCVHTAEDIHSGHVRIAKELGGEKSLYQVSSYHDANEILSVADDAGATAIHPGYGFFAEDFRFARRVTTRERKLIFIGPSWRVIRELGDKINTKRLARSLGVPTVPGSDRPIYDEMEAEKIARSLYDFQLQQGITGPQDKHHIHSDNVGQPQLHARYHGHQRGQLGLQHKNGQGHGSEHRHVGELAHGHSNQPPVTASRSS